jgi:hypothetical protein
VEPWRSGLRTVASGLVRVQDQADAGMDETGVHGYGSNSGMTRAVPGQPERRGPQNFRLIPTLIVRPTL